MIEVPLTQGKTVIVDARGYMLTCNRKFYARNEHGKWYACTKIDGKQVKMEHLLMGKRLLDHIDGNSLNDMECNLRPATPAQNAANRKPMSKCGYKGVWQQNGQWRAGVKQHGKTFHLGGFETAEAAARAYDTEARKRWGEYARCNFPQEENDMDKQPQEENNRKKSCRNCIYIASGYCDVPKCSNENSPVGDLRGDFQDIFYCNLFEAKP